MWHQVLLTTAVLILLAKATAALHGRSPVPFMHHASWDEALFLHFPVDAASLQSRLPAGLEVDMHKGKAWVGVVALTELGISPMLPFLPRGVQRFLRLGHHAVNVRTYVKCGNGPPGIYFFTLDCSGMLPALGASLLFNLPYRLAKMARNTPQPGTSSFASTRRGAAAALQVEWECEGKEQTEGEVAREAAFFVERYCLYNEAGPFLRVVGMARDENLWRGTITHTPWPVQRVGIHKLQETLLGSLDLQPTGPCLAHFSKGVKDIKFCWQAVPPTLPR